MDKEKYKKLREKATEVLKNKDCMIPEAYQDMALERLLQEVEIFHAELEAQNEELREQQIAIATKNKDLNLLFDHAPIGYILLDKTHTILNANILAKNILGLSKSRLRHEQFYNYIAQGEVKRFLDWCLDYERLKKPLRISVRQRDKIRHVQLDLHAIEDVPKYKIFLSIQDETHLINVAHERDRYLEVLDQHVMISRTDFDGYIQYVSDAFCQTTGYTKEELTGHTHNLLRDPDTPESTYTELWNTVTAGEVWKGELKNRKKNGETYWVYATISPWYDADGILIGYTAIRQNITDKKRIEVLSTHDSLTGLYNRAKLDEVMAYEMAQARRYKKELSIILLDIDHFKRVNDNFGHLQGDSVLKKLATLLLSNIRESDSVGRWGGEEFLIICPNTGLQGAASLAEKVRQIVENSDFGHLDITCSFGVSVIFDEIDEDALLQQADDALYRAKDLGRNRVISKSELLGKHHE